MYIFSNSFFYSLNNNLILLLLYRFSKGYSLIFVFNNQFFRIQKSFFSIELCSRDSPCRPSPCRPSLYLLVSLFFHFPFAPLLFSPLLDPMSHFPISPFHHFPLSPFAPLLVPLSPCPYFPLPREVPLSRIDLCSSTILMFPSA